MKQYDLTPLKDNDTEYGKAIDVVEANYKCAWDDKVHDSFLRYVKHIQDYARRVHVVRCKAETLEKELDGLRIDELKTASDRLCREADSI
jgi:hypothetical protein